jgi:phasin family protein
MFSGIEQFPAAGKAQLDAQLSLMTALASASLDSAGKLAALNLGTVKAIMADYPFMVQQGLAASTPQEWLSLASVQMRPSLERMMTYGRQLAELTLAAQTDMSAAAQRATAQASAAPQAAAPAPAKAKSSKST